MPNFRCEYKVSGDFIFDSFDQICKLTLKDGTEITFENFEDRHKNEATLLRVTVVGLASNLDSAENELRNILAGYLDRLSLVTHSRFRIEQPIYVIEWNEGQKEREYIVFSSYDGRYPPSPHMHPNFFGMAGSIPVADETRWLDRALQFYRLGLLADDANSQHSLFWKVLEIIAEKIIEKKDTPRTCEHCASELICKSCDTIIMAPPIARESIGKLFDQVSSDKDGAIFKRNYKLRNHITHGRELKETDAHAEDLVDEIHDIARTVLIGIIRGTGKQVTLPQFGTTLHRQLMLMPRMLMRHEGVEPHPNPKDIPIPQVELVTRFGSAEDAE